MSLAQSAFTDVRKATELLKGEYLKLNELQVLRREILGWKSNVAQFRAFADEQIATLPRGDVKKKMLRKQKKDLSVAVAAFRDHMTVTENVRRSSRAMRSDAKTTNVALKSHTRVEKAVRAYMAIDRDAAIALLTSLIEETNTENYDTSDKETVEID